MRTKPGFVWSISLLSYGVDGSQLAGGGYYCYVLCLAGRLESGQNRNLSTSRDHCRQYGRNDFCTASTSTCKKDCGNLKVGSGPAPSVAPTNVFANYSTEPQPNPYVVNVQWSKMPSANLYVVQYFQFGEKGEKDAGMILGHEESTDTKALINRDKKSLCVRYGFRVAAVNQNGVGPFSDDVILDKPSPVYLTKPSYKLKSLAYTDKEFKVDALGETSTDPNTVEATVEFTPPPNWQMSDFVSANDYVHTLMCKRASTDSFTTRSNLSATAAEMIVPFPGKNVQSDCTYLYTLLGLNTICGTTVQFPDPADSGGASTAGLGIFINVSCATVANTPCKAVNESKQPSCAVRDFGYEIASKSDQTASVTLTWGDILNPKSWPIEYYIIKYSLSEKPATDLVLVLPIVKNVGTAKTCSGSGSCDGKSKTVTIEKLDLGKYFVAQICAVYDSSLESSIPWNAVARYPIDLTGNASSTSGPNGSTGTVPQLSTKPSPATEPASNTPTTATSAITPQTGRASPTEPIASESTVITSTKPSSDSSRCNYNMQTDFAVALLVLLISHLWHL